MTRFEERLLAALKEELAGRAPAARPATRRRVWVPAAALTGVAAAAILVATSVAGWTGSPAFAVTKQSDGSVQVRISEFRDPGELEAELARQGVKAEVDYLPPGQTCKAPRGAKPSEADKSRVEMQIKGGEGVTFTLKAGQVAQGRTVVLAVTRDEAKPAEPPIAVSLEIVEGAVSACEAVPLPQPSKGEGGSGPGLVTKTDGPGSGEPGSGVVIKTDGPSLDSGGE
ncbi:hypothetical protein [Thermoactinospora rubra]|uniref:hypothetical protein n=1 Tax=Thermoactinospora rubra TaxID=1088767 RepID=UPI000A11C8D5|nr:hypothetical protein [Thermoactinospora rubra]